MTCFKEPFIVIGSIPLYVVVILAEILYSYFLHLKLYSLKGTIHNVVLSTLNALLDNIMKGACLMVLDYFYQFHFFEIKNTFWYWF